MKPKIQTPWNRVGDHGEKNTKPGITIPDQSMSVKEIMDRFARGLPVGGMRVPIYDGENDDMPDLRNMDLADRQAYMEAAQEEYEILQERIKKSKPLAQKPVEQDTIDYKELGSAIMEHYRKTKATTNTPASDAGK